MRILMCILTVALFYAHAVLAKGNEDNPTAVVIDPSGNDVDASISGTVDVNVSNSTPIPVEVQSGDRIPYTFAFECLIPGNDSNCTSSVLFTPGFDGIFTSDRIFVIERVNAICGIPEDLDCSVALRWAAILESGQFISSEAIPLTLTPGSSFSYSGVQSIRGYLGKRSAQSFGYYIELSIRADLSENLTPGMGDANVFAAVSGYLVSADSPSLAP